MTPGRQDYIHAVLTDMDAGPRRAASDVYPNLLHVEIEQQPHELDEDVEFDPPHR